MTEKIIGVILAGGKSTRMNGLDKAQAKLGNLSLLEHSVQRARPQVDTLLINLHSSASNPLATDLTIIHDQIEDHAGPLAGILSSLEWVQENRPDCKSIATFPVDSPFFPIDLIKRLHETKQASGAQVTIPRYGQQRHWVFGLWSVELIDSLKDFLLVKRLRKVRQWIGELDVCEVDFSDLPEDPFFNINTLEELAMAKKQWLENQSY